jgi:hypothetical protein
MTTAKSNGDLSPTVPTMKRRGLLAAAAGFVAGLVARVTERPLSAAGSDGDVVLGGGNSATQTTTIDVTGADGLQVSATASGTVSGVVAFGTQYGVVGVQNAVVQNSGVAGVRGQANLANANGVFGSSDHGIGVRAATDSGQALLAQSFTTGHGVLAVTRVGYPIVGHVPSDSTSNTTAIFGINASSNGTGGTGGFGMYGVSLRGHGVVGATTAPGAASIVGATNGIAGTHAGAFFGPVVVSGDFTVMGGAKSAAVPHPDGTHRRLYCMESPESWFEDFGDGALVCGRADVRIDPDFAAVTDVARYHVFLTAYDTEVLLHVKNRTATGFTVEADPDVAALKGRKDADLSGPFSWRVVARRKDIRGERLATVMIPKEPPLPAIPDLPNPPATNDTFAPPKG